MQMKRMPTAGIEETPHRGVSTCQRSHSRRENHISSLRLRASAVIFLSLLGIAQGFSQEDSFRKQFKLHREVVPGVDFFAAKLADTTPFQQPIAEARKKLTDFLGAAISKGAIVVCTSAEQRDSVNEKRVLALGYSWVLIQLTPEAVNEQMMARMKAQAAQMPGGQLPPGLLDRLRNQPPEMKAAAEKRMVSGVVQRFGYAAIFATLAPDKEFRSSRLDDMGRSPLADWLDIGLAAYSSGNANSTLGFLQQRLDEGFPLEDVLEMSRPFVPPSSGGGGGGEGMVIRMAGPPGGGAAGGPAPAGATPPGGATPGAARGGVSMSMPKDIQDRMTFDAQSASFFNFLLHKTSIDKVRELVKWSREGKSPREFITRPDVLGPDLDATEKAWHGWLKTQKAEGPAMRTIQNPGPTPRPPQRPPQ